MLAWGVWLRRSEVGHRSNHEQQARTAPWVAPGLANIARVRHTATPRMPIVSRKGASTGLKRGCIYSGRHSHVTPYFDDLYGHDGYEQRAFAHHVGQNEHQAPTSEFDISV